MTFDFMEQSEKCGGGEFNIAMDNLFSRWKDATGGAMAIGTQLITGWEKQDTSAYIAWRTMTKDTGTGNYDYQNLGKGILMLLS